MGKKVETNIDGTPAREPGQRHSDRIEYRRGRNDGEAGLAAVSLCRLYMNGYAEGRRLRAVKVRSAANSDDPSASSPRFPHM